MKLIKYGVTMAHSLSRLQCKQFDVAEWLLCDVIYNHGLQLRSETDYKTETCEINTPSPTIQNMVKKISKTN